MLGGLGVTPLYTYENRASVLISWRLPACRAWRVPKDGRAHGPHPLPFMPPRAAGEGQPLAGWRVPVDPLRALGCLPRAELTGACLVRSGTAPAVGNSPTFVLVCPAPPAVLSQGWPSPPGPGQLPAGGESPARCLPAPRGPPSAPPPHAGPDLQKLLGCELWCPLGNAGRKLGGLRQVRPSSLQGGGTGAGGPAFLLSRCLSGPAGQPEAGPAPVPCSGTVTLVGGCVGGAGAVFRGSSTAWLWATRPPRCWLSHLGDPALWRRVSPLWCLQGGLWAWRPIL